MSLSQRIKQNSQWVTQALTNHNRLKDFIEPLMQIAKPSWQAKDHATQVIGKRIESDLVYSLILKPSKNWKRHVAGQHISIQVEINGVRYHRVFSISSSPEYHKQTGLIELTIRKQSKGRVTQWMASQLTINSWISISAASGEFTLPNHNKPLLLIAGGSGITPFRSFLHQMATENRHQDIHLIYYNQSTTPLFEEEWQQLTENLANLNVSFIDTELQGQITSHQLAAICKDFAQRQTYLCGPPGLITSSRDILTSHDVDDADIHHELFGPKPINRSTANTKAKSVVTFSDSNKKINWTAQHSLLHLAETADLNPPSGCRMGVCHQCKCNKKQGVVYNTLTETYSDTGAEDIQLCVSIPIGDVTLDL